MVIYLEEPLLFQEKKTSKKSFTEVNENFALSFNKFHLVSPFFFFPFFFEGFYKLHWLMIAQKGFGH